MQLCNWGFELAKTRRVSGVPKPIEFTKSAISISPDLKKERMDFQTQHCATAASEDFSLNHRTFSIQNSAEEEKFGSVIKFRWRAHLYRFKMVEDSTYGFVASTYSELRDGGEILGNRTKKLRFEELCRLVELPLSTEPTLYVEVSRLRDKTLDSTPPMEWGLNTNENVVTRKLLLSSTPAPIFTSTFPGGKTGYEWKSWWSKTHTVAGIEPSSLSGIWLNTKAGQASGAHGEGWIDRGGRMVSTNAKTNHDISGNPNGSYWTNLRLERAGLILFSLEVNLNDEWVGMPQDFPHLTNPLSLPIHLDGAEQKLIEIINDKSVKLFDDWLGNSTTPVGERYPIESWSKNSHSLPRKIKSNSKSILVNDYEVIIGELQKFIEVRLFKHWFPWFEDSLSGSLW